ncbi:MAG: protein kinase, partial [Rhodothermaceae bacterium]|nr:protein kinase [Rhodothermaceae bacterium]
MSLDYWSRAKPLFEAARQHPPADRAAFLDEACAEDATLRAEVERLLALDDEADGFFDTLGEAIRRPEPEAVPLPERVGPWRIVREVGRGGMGRVLLGERDDDRFEQRVAIKVVESAAPGLVERFRRERRILARLDHPHVARLLDGGALPDGRPYLVMEYVEGEPLTRYAEEKQLSLEERLRLFGAVCDVVAYAHRNLVVHRDLKPSNILVSTEGTVKLLDFGIARLLSDEEGDALLTGTEQRLHTPVYAAPEQIRGEPVTTATDVYALGVVLYELLTSHRPFHPQGRDRRALERAILKDKPTAPSAAVDQELGRLRRRLRGDLDRIVLKALRKEPDRRYGSVGALARDVERHLAGLPVEARPATLGYRFRSFVRRHRTGVAMTAVAVGLLVLFGTLYTVRVTAERNRAEAAAARAERVTGVLTDLLAQAEESTTDAGVLLSLLEPTVARADSELAADPDARAAVFYTLGRLYNRIGLRNEADSLLRQSLALRRVLHTDPHQDLAATLYALGVRFIPVADSAHGLAYFRDAAGMQRALYDGDQPALAWSLLQWDRVLPHDHPEKGRRYEEALAMFARLYGPRSPEVAEAIHEYYVLGLAAGTPEDYEAAFAEALAIYQENGLERDPRTLAAMYNLGLHYERQGDFDRAFPLFRQAIRLGQEIHPPGSPFLNTMMVNYGASLHEQGQFVEADRVLRDAAEQARRALPEGAAAIGHSHYWHGRNLVALDRSAEAVPALRIAAANYHARTGESPRYHRVQTELGWALVQLGRFDEAERLLLESADALHGTA